MRSLILLANLDIGEADRLGRLISRRRLRPSPYLRGGEFPMSTYTTIKGSMDSATGGLLNLPQELLVQVFLSLPCRSVLLCSSVRPFLA